MKLLFAAFCILASCNIQDANAQLRLIGVTPPNYDPNNVVVIFNKHGRRVCSGALIHSEWVLTSATCGIRTFDEEMRVKVGGAVSLNFNSAEHIKNTYIHTNYFGWSLENDIALIQLVSPTSTFVRTLKVADGNNQDRVGQKGYVLGYGDNEQNTADGTLRQHKISILDNMICSKLPVHIDSNRLCTYESKACEGDQGGPLVSEDKRTLLGLISITDNQASMCGGDKLIPVTTYTRVSPYKDWIKEITKINYL